MGAPLKKHKSTLIRILNYIGVYRWLVWLSLLLAALTVATTLYAPILVGRAVDLILGPGKVDFAGLLAILRRIGLVAGLSPTLTSFPRGSSWGLPNCLPAY